MNIAMKRLLPTIIIIATLFTFSSCKPADGGKSNPSIDPENVGSITESEFSPLTSTAHNFFKTKTGMYIA